MGVLDRRFLALALLLLAAAASAALQEPQALLSGYGKEFRPFINYNGIPIAPRPSPWIRAAEIQRADADAFPGDRPEQPPAFLQQQQQQPFRLPAGAPVYQAAGPPPFRGGQGPQVYEHSMLLIDHPPEQMLPQPQQPEQQAAFRNGDQEPQAEEHSMVMVEQQPAQVVTQQGQPDQQAILSGDAMSAGGPSQEAVAEQAPPADQLTSAQESGPAAVQVAQQDGSLPAFIPYQGPRPLGVIFQSNEPYPGLSPPPAYQLEQVAWGAQQPMQVPVYPNPFREQPPQQPVAPAPAAVGSPLPAAYYPDDFQAKGGYQPFLQQRQAYDAARAGFGGRPFAEDRSGMVPRPPGGVAPFPMPSSYLPETPLEEPKQDEVVPDKSEESQPHDSDNGKDDSSEEGDDEASDEIESKVKALKDAVDVEEEVVPALVVFLRKKGHKAFHDKDSVGIPGKEDRFRRSPGIGSGSSSHSSSSSSSSSGPLYFGDGGGSYSSSSSQSSASSNSGGGGGSGAPLGLGAGSPGLGGSNAFYGGGHVPPSGFGVSGGGGYGNNGYGNTGYGNTGYGNAGHGSAGFGNTGHGSAGYGSTGYGGGVGGVGGGGYGGYGGGGGCATCGDDSNVLLNRFGEAEGGAPFSVGGSGASKGQGVHSSASSSIDSTGKVTYSVSAGKH